MPSQRLSRRLLGLIVAVILVPPIALIMNLPWLKQQPQGLAILLAGVASILVVGAGLALSVLIDRHQDEWHRSGSRFAGQWGTTIGTCVVALLLVVPPFRDGIVSLVTDVAGDGAHREYKMVVLAFTLGFAGLTVAQAVCTVMAHLAWNFRMSRPAKDSA